MDGTRIGIGSKSAFSKQLKGGLLAKIRTRPKRERLLRRELEGNRFAAGSDLVRTCFATGNGTKIHLGGGCLLIRTRMEDEATAAQPLKRAQHCDVRCSYWLRSTIPTHRPLHMLSKSVFSKQLQGAL